MTPTLIKTCLTGALLPILWLPAVHTAAGESSVFAQASLEQMIENSGTVSAVQLRTPPGPVRFEASVASLPQPWKARYLLEVLAVMGVDPVPEVTHGMNILSRNSTQVMVYLEKSAAERAGKELKAGDRVTLFGYHVFDSKKHGPGILVSDFETHSFIDGWKEKVVQLLNDAMP